jgi:hypothetical protein
MDHKVDLAGRIRKKEWREESEAKKRLRSRIYRKKKF